MLVDGILIFITLPCKPDSHSEGDVLYTLVPNMLVQASINPNIGSSHHLLSKLLDLFDCARCSSFETYSMNSLVQVYGVFSGNNLGYSLPFLVAGHDYSNYLLYSS